MAFINPVTLDVRGNMIRILIFITLMTNALASEESKHQPLKVTQHFNKTIFGDFTLTVESFKDHGIKGYVKSVEIKLKDKTIKLPKELLGKIGFVKMNHWIVSTATGFDGKGRIYLKNASIDLQSENKSETDFIICITRDGFEELWIDGKVVLESKQKKKKP